MKLLLDDAREQARDEDNRGASFNQRAGVLLGLEAAASAVVMSQAGRVIDQDLGSVGVPLAAAALVAAGVLILVSALYSIKSLNVAQVWHMNDAGSHGTTRFVIREPTEMRGELLLGWGKQFDRSRASNNNKADALRTAFLTLGASFVPLAVVVVLSCLPAFGI